MLWTNEQITAINGRAQNILVSAAAGSGKTAVIVERVLRRLLKKDNPESISDFLIVTFTNAAAAQMRARLATAISDALSQRPGNAHLRRQSLLIHSAKIMTVHAFCLSLLREYIQASNASSDFRLADENEVSLLRREALDNLMEEEYASKRDIFYTLVESVSRARDDTRLCELILQGYDAAMNDEDPEKYLEELSRRSYVPPGTDIGTIPWGEIFLRDISERTEYEASRMSECLTLLSADLSGLSEKYLPTFTQEHENLILFVHICKRGDWDEIRSFLLNNLTFARIPSAPRSSDQALKERVKKVRDNVKAWANRLSTGLIYRDAKGITEDINAISPLIIEFSELVGRFSAHYDSVKRDAHVLTFTDIEHLALGMLSAKGEDGQRSPSPLAVELADQFAELMVDEYQDTNGIQDAIFKSLTKCGMSGFFVGDMKQSIYRFRRADPMIFNRMKKTYQKFSVQNSDKGEFYFEHPDISLSFRHNFRSRIGVLDSVNHVFSKLMSEDLGEIEYSDDESLLSGIEQSAPDCGMTELDILDITREAKSSEQPESGEYPELLEFDVSDGDFQVLSSRELEAKHIAKRIKKLLLSKYEITDSDLGGKRPIRQSDIAILMRSAINRMPTMLAALAEQGIEASSSGMEDFFESSEINAMMALLSVVDNPRQDLALAGCLRSPFFGFTEDELARIKLCGDKDDLFHDALQACSEMKTQLGKRCADFLEELKNLRLAVADKSVSSTLNFIADFSGASTIFGAMESGNDRLANLYMLFELARDFEKYQNGGLGDFLRYFEKVENNDLALKSSTKSSGDGVKAMTIHRSKGLEFPVVFLVFTSDRMNNANDRAQMLLHQSYGAGLKRRFAKSLHEYTTLPLEAIRSVLESEQLSEELRSLYVAMTRAKEKLFISIAQKNVSSWKEKLENNGSAKELTALCKKHKSLGDWLGASILFDDNAPFKINYIESYEKSADIEEISTENMKSGAGIQEFTEKDEEQEVLKLADIIKSRLTYIYPHARVSTIPAKLTATAYKGMTQIDDDAEPLSFGAHERRGSRVPSFIHGRRTVSPTERGTAVHLAMQLLPMKQYTHEDSVQKELLILREKELISQEQLELVSPDAILAFYQSDIGQKVLSLPLGKVIREFKFSILVPAKDYFPDLVKDSSEKVLLQGVIDLYFENKDGTLSLLDFKTDRITRGSENAAARRHLSQLAVYKYCLREVTGKAVSQAGIYFFETGSFVPDVK